MEFGRYSNGQRHPSRRKDTPQIVDLHALAVGAVAQLSAVSNGEQSNAALEIREAARLLLTILESQLTEWTLETSQSLERWPLANDFLVAKPEIWFEMFEPVENWGEDFRNRLGVGMADFCLQRSVALCAAEFGAPLELRDFVSDGGTSLDSMIAKEEQMA